MHICMNQLTQERTNQHEIQNQRHPLSLYLHPRSVAAFHLRMVGRQPHRRTVLGSQRIHMGALKAALLPDASAHAGRAVLLPRKNAGKLPFYTLNGILGKNYDWINIALYFAGVAFALFVENDVYRNGKAEKLILSSAILLLLTAAFFTFTEYPPQLGIFREI